MKKVFFYAILFTVLMLDINVNAKYADYKSGDIIVIKNETYVVIEDSNSNNDKLKIMPAYYMGVLNKDEIVSICGVPRDSSRGGDEEDLEIYPDNYMQCVTEHAQLCSFYSLDGQCEPLSLPFDTDESFPERNIELAYDDNSNTNIGYFFKNSLDSYYKTLFGLDDVKTRLLTADEQIQYMDNKDSIILDIYRTAYNSMGDNCTIGVTIKASNTAPVISNDNIGSYMFGSYMVNSLKYSKDCYSLATTFYDDSVNKREYVALFSIRPLIEISKKEFMFELTKEKEGSGSLEVTVDNSYKVGDIISINDMSYTVIEISNNQVRMLPVNPVLVSNYDELNDLCGTESSSGLAPKSPENISSTEHYQCIIEHAKYCDSEIENCEPLLLPYNYNDRFDHEYNPNVETNAGHYIKNELKDVIQEQIDINVIDVDVLTYNEYLDLMDNNLIIMNGYFLIPIPNPGTGTTNLNSFSSGTRNLTSGDKAYSPIPAVMLNYNDVLTEMNGFISTRNLIIPVITVSTNDLPVQTKPGSTVRIITNPEEGYYLKELKVNDDENNNLIYTPNELVKYERGEYTFKMTSSNANVYALFAKIEHYEVKSLSEELIITEGSNKIGGEKVRYTIRLKDGDVLTKVVYYDNDNREVEIPYTDKGNGEYEFIMPEMNVFLRAVIKYADPVYNLYGKDLTMTTQKSKEGETLTFTIKGNKKVSKIAFRDENGKEIHPNYSVNNGVYSIVMPANDVYVEITYEEEALPDKIENNNTSSPITGDNINESTSLFIVGLIIFVLCIYFIKKVNKKNIEVIERI